LTSKKREKKGKRGETKAAGKWAQRREGWKRGKNSLVVQVGSKETREHESEPRGGRRGHSKKTTTKRRGGRGLQRGRPPSTGVKTGTKTGNSDAKKNYKNRGTPKRGEPEREQGRKKKKRGKKNIPSRKMKGMLAQEGGKKTGEKKKGKRFGVSKKGKKRSANRKRGQREKGEQTAHKTG